MADLIRIHELPPPPPRAADAHKGSFGTVIVVGGCPTMLGAPALAASAALRAGVGLVKIAAAPQVISAALTIEPGATGIMLGDDLPAALHQFDAVDPRNEAVLAVGPGLGQSDEARALVTALLRGRRSMVLDADGLNILAQSLSTAPFPGARMPLIVTPHPGEYRRLAEPLRIALSPTDPATRPAAAAALASALNAVTVLKGSRTVVSDGRRVYINETGNPALATAGSGDVLTGLAAALRAQRMPAFDAAVLAVYLHGLAADLWANIHGLSGLTARDLATILPDAFNQHRHPPA